MNWTADLPRDKECKGCGERMFGITVDFPAKMRDLCDGCGGNKTDFNASNPKPKDLTA